MAPGGPSLKVSSGSASSSTEGRPYRTGNWGGGTKESAVACVVAFTVPFAMSF